MLSVLLARQQLAIIPDTKFTCYVNPFIYEPIYATHTRPFGAKPHIRQIKAVTALADVKTTLATGF